MEWVILQPTAFMDVWLSPLMGWHLESGRARLLGKGADASWMRTSGETAVQAAYFGGLRADVITSCCGSLFSADAQGPASSIAGMPAGPMQAALIASLAVTFASGLLYGTRRSWAGRSN